MKLKMPAMVCLILFSTLHTRAGCPTGNITLTSQAQVNSFSTTYSGCTVMPYSLTVSEDFVTGDITNLIGLSQLVEINGLLKIQNNSHLINLSGLSALTKVGEFYVSHNSELADLSGIEGLVAINGYCTIYENPKLVGLAGLSSLTSVKNDLSISGDKLASLSALSSLKTVEGYLRIDDCPQLPALTGLSAVTSLGGGYISECPFLGDLSGLSALITINGNLYIDDNDGLLNLSGLDVLSSVFYLFIKNNASLVSVAGIPLLTSKVRAIYIENNPLLKSLSGFSHMTSVGNGLPSDGIFLWNNNALNSISGLRNISLSKITNLEITDSPSLSACNVPNICSYLADRFKSADISGNATGCASRQQVITACSSPLPVKLISFGVVGLEGSNQLHWETAEEIDNDYFEVMRGRNATMFTTVGVLKSKSLGKAETMKYEYQDRTVGRGTTYYRLKQVDKNGEYSLSRIISVQNEKALNSFLYPNPANTHLMVAADLGYYKIINTKGVVVREGVGRVSEPIDVAKFPAGIYQIVADSGSYRFVKE